MYYLNSFLLYSLIGFIFESTLYKNIGVSKASGILKGPLTIVYGLGGLTIITIDKYIISKIKINKILKIIISFIIYAISLGVVELISGYLCKLIFSVDMWNYSDKKYNIGKYTCLEYLPIWSLFALIITNILKPYFDKIIKIIPKEATYIFYLFMVFDLLITIITK